MPWPGAMVCVGLGVTMVRRWDLWQPCLAVVDVTNPAARKWYEEKLEALIDLGVDTFKVSSWRPSVRQNRKS